MGVEIDRISLPAPAEVKVEFTLTAQVNVTDLTAQRKVSKLLLDHVGNLLYGERPSLVMGRRLLWRVPVWLALPTAGPLGQVGALDVDAQTGKVLSTQQILEEIAERGDELALRQLADSQTCKLEVTYAHLPYLPRRTTQMPTPS